MYVVLPHDLLITTNNDPREPFPAPGNPFRSNDTHTWKIDPETPPTSPNISLSLDKPSTHPEPHK